MRKQRSRFWTVVFSFLPGAGHMFMGFMKLGVSMMACFFALIFLSSWLNIGPIMYLTPILWFYSFFDSINKAFSGREEFAAFEDHYLFSADRLLTVNRRLKGNAGIALGILLLVVGGYLTLQKLLGIAGIALPERAYAVLSGILSSIPQIFFGLLIIALGIWLIIGKKKEMDRNV